MKESVSTYMVVVKEKHHQAAEWQSYEHPLGIESPKLDYPVARLRRLECAHSRNSILLGPAQTSREVREAHPEQSREDKRVVGEKTPDPRPPDRAATNLFETIDGAKEEHGDHDGQVATFKARNLEKVDEFFYSLDCVASSAKNNLL